MESRKKMARFNDHYDMKLLKEVVARNPFANSKDWVPVADSVSDDDIFTIDGRRARERTNLMVSKFKRDTTKALKQSGVNEDVTEKDVLLQEIVDLIHDSESNIAQAKGVKDRAKSDEAAAKDMRKRAMEGMKKDHDEPKPKSKRMNSLGYLQSKQEAEMEMRRQELDVKKQELDLQRQRFELEKQERQAAIDVQKKQTDMMMMLLNKNK